MDFHKAKIYVDTAMDDVTTTAGGDATLIDDDEFSFIDYGGNNDDKPAMDDAADSDKAEVDEVDKMEVDEVDKMEVDAQSVLTSHRADSTRLSKSTPSNMRSAGRQAKRLERMLESSRKRAEAEGREFVVIDREEYREQQRKKMLIVLQPTDQTKTTQELISEEKTRNDKNKFSTEEKMRYTFAIDEFFRPKFVQSPMDERIYYDCHARYVLPRDGAYYCYLCNKWADEVHTNSQLHVQRLLEMSSADEMIGTCVSFRRWEEEPGLQGPLTRQRFMQFWGSKVTNMIQIIRDRIMSGASIKVAYSTKGRVFLNKGNTLNFGLCCVSYPGQGKYSDTFDRAVRWEDLQAEDQLQDAPMMMTGGYDQLIDEKNCDQQQIVDNCGKEGGERKYMDGYSMQGRGWWPAIIVTWDGENLCFGTYDRRAYYKLQNQGRLRVWVICWYQLCDGTNVMEAWPIYLVTPFARL